MSVVLDSSGDSTRGLGIVMIPLMCGALSARPLRVAAFFTMLFLLIAGDGVRATDGPPRHVIPVSPLDQFVHRGFVRTDYLSLHGNKIHMASNDRALAYFLLERPVDLSLSTLPANAQNVLVARVRLSDPPLYLAGRTIQSMSPPPSDLYSARLEILSVLQGEAPSESRPLVTFWPRDNARLDMPLQCRGPRSSSPQTILW